MEDVTYAKKRDDQLFSLSKVWSAIRQNKNIRVSVKRSKQSVAWCRARVLPAQPMNESRLVDGDCADLKNIRRGHQLHTHSEYYEYSGNTIDSVQTLFTGT